MRITKCDNCVREEVKDGHCFDFDVSYGVYYINEDRHDRVLKVMSVCICDACAGQIEDRLRTWSARTKTVIAFTAVAMILAAFILRQVYSLTSTGFAVLLLAVAALLVGTYRYFTKMLRLEESLLRNSETILRKRMKSKRTPFTVRRRSRSDSSSAQRK